MKFSKYYHTGIYEIRAGQRELFLLLILVTIGIESIIYFSDFWFLGGHSKSAFFFSILSLVVFWSMLRNLFSWFFYFFVSIPYKPEKQQQKWTIDVLTTAMPGEPYEMFEQTLKKIAEINGEHTTYLLDGGNDERLRKLCEATGTIHINCVGIKGAKAGKVNYCLGNFAKGEIVLVIDPDHMPEKDFFDRVVPYFEDKNVGFVQVVQAYYNQDKTIVAQAAAEQTYGFYGPLMMSLNGMGIPLSIGANCTFRRATLDSIGGHAVGLAEDAQTSIRIHAKGWRSVYIPYRGSYGLVPEKLSSFFKQQMKWSCGMFRLFFDEYFSLLKTLPWAGKIYYLFAGTHYLNGFITFLTILLPIVFLFFRVFAIEMSLFDFLFHLTPYVLSSFVITMYIQKWYTCKREKRLPWRSMLLEKGTWHIYLLGFIYALIKKEVLWLPTPKTSAKERSVGLVMPHGIAIFLSAMAILFAYFTYPRIDEGTLLMMFFALLNIAVLLPTFILGIKKQEGL